MSSQIALVTGASRGIGRAIATRLAAQGHTVIGTATTEGGAELISQAFRESGLQGRGKALDVCEGSAIEGFLEAVTDEFGVPTILVNNAGITRDNLLMRMKDEEWDVILQTNLSSVYRMSKACLRGMVKARQGRIVNITSVVGVTGNAGQSNYAAAKAGVIGFTKSLAQELAAKGVTVNAVAPGYVGTNMVMAIREDVLKGIIDAIPMKRLCKPEEIGGICAYLASDISGYMTGATLNINGGSYYQ